MAAFPKDESKAVNSFWCLFVLVVNDGGGELPFSMRKLEKRERGSGSLRGGGGGGGGG
jgi:hypothetical protein